MKLCSVLCNTHMFCAQKPGLQFGAAQSYVSLEKVGEGAFSSVFKGISRSEVTYEPQHTHSSVTGCLTCVSSSVEDKRAAGGSEGDSYEDGGGRPVHGHQRRWRTRLYLMSLNTQCGF